jgi:UDP-glucose 4-epimerase
MNKPTITFYEPYEMIVEKNGEIVSYLDDVIQSENELLEKYNINYKSFYTKDIRDEKGMPTNFQSNNNIHAFILAYIHFLQS